MLEFDLLLLIHGLSLFLDILIEELVEAVLAIIE